MSTDNPWQWLAKRRLGAKDIVRMVGEEVERGGRRGAFVRVAERTGMPYGRVRSIVYSWKRKNKP